MTINCSDSSWTGGVFVREAADRTGNVISIKGHRNTLKDIVIRGWQKDATTFIRAWKMGRAIAVNGDDNRIYNPTIRDPEDEVGTGGIRVTGGKRFLCVGGYVESGDDALAFVPTPPGTAQNMTGEISVTDATVSDMVLHSRHARAINFGLSTGDDMVLTPGDWSSSDDLTPPPPHLVPVIYQTSSLTRCRVSNIAAYADGGSVLFIRNDYSSGIISDIDVANVTLECGPNVDKPVVIRSTAGPVRRIRLNSTSVFVDPATTIAQEIVTVRRVDGFFWTGGRIDPPIIGTSPTVQVQGVIGGALRDLSIGCGAADGVLLTRDTPDSTNEFGQTARECRNVSIESGVIENIAPGAFGINFDRANASGARNMIFTLALAASATDVPPMATLTGLRTTDPLFPTLYSVTVQPTPVSPLAPPLFFTVRGPSPALAAIGQGRVGTLFDSSGLRFMLNGTVTPGDISVIVAGSLVTRGKAVRLGSASSACYVECCDLNAFDVGATPFDVSTGHGHRIADIFPVTTTGNYTGGILDAANLWTVPQTFTIANVNTGLTAASGAITTLTSTTATIDTLTSTTASAKSLSIGRANVTIASDAVTFAASIMILTAEGGASTDNLYTINGTVTGSLVILRSGSGQTITIKDTNSGTAGNLRLASDCMLNTVDDSITLFRGANGFWYEIARSDNLVPP